MKVEEVFIKGFHDSHLHVMVVQAENAKGNLHIIHGMGEHAKRYTDFALFLAENGFNVYMHDHRGHGKSLKPNQDVGILNQEDTLFNMVKDIHYVKDFIETQHDLPYYLLGHSMGSVITRYFLQTNPNTIVKKAIIMGTLPKYPLIQVKAMRTLAFLLGLFKSSNLRHQGLANVLNSGLIKTIENPKTDFDWLSYNQNNVDLYVQDPLCGYAYNKRFYQSFFKLIDKVNKKSSMKNLKTMPLLFIAGIDDPINQNMKGINKLVKLYQRINPTLAIEVQAIDKARHEILHENNKKETYDIIKTFLTK